MALDPSTEFTGKITAPDANYPYGSARDITVPGDGTGTPWLASLVNDIFGFQQALLNAASIVPSGSPDTILASDYLDAVDTIKARLANNQQLVGRNFADTLYRDLLGLNASDVIELGNAVSDIEVLSTSFQLAGDITLPTGDVVVTSGDLIIGTDVLFVDTSATAAGINDANPDCPLLVVGPSSVGGHLTPAASTMLTLKNRGGLDCGFSLISDGSNNKFINWGTNGDEDIGRITYTLNTFVFRTNALDRMIIDEGVTVGSPTGGDKGAGSVNAEEIYANGVAVNPWTKHATVHTGISSGTTLDWTGIPPAATHIKIVFQNHSAAASQDLVLKVGHGGGVESAGYKGRVHDGSAGTNWGSFADITKGATAGDITHGTIELTHITGFGWGIHGACMEEGGSMHLAVGSKILSAALDRAELSMSAGAAFDGTGGGGDYALYYM